MQHPLCISSVCTKFFTTHKNMAAACHQYLTSLHICLYILLNSLSLHNKSNGIQTKQNKKRHQCNHYVLHMLHHMWCNKSLIYYKFCTDKCISVSQVQFCLTQSLLVDRITRRLKTEEYCQKFKRRYITITQLPFFSSNRKRFASLGIVSS